MTACALDLTGSNMGRMKLRGGHGELEHGRIEYGRYSKTRHGGDGDGGEGTATFRIEHGTRH